MQIFPKLEDIEKASREQLAQWFSHLPAGDTLAQKRIMERINQRFKKLGGMTPELEKKLRF